MNTENSYPVVNHFIRHLMEDDLANGRHQTIVTRFPPEPNGYLHIGHAKAICLNFGLARDYNGRCHLRMDDTNPEKESDEYVQSIQESVRWLGFQWDGNVRYASDYFEAMYLFALELIRAGYAYVCDLDADKMRAYRGTLTEPGQDSPYRTRSVEENLDLFTQMRNGMFADGSKTLRLKIDMTSGNINLRDPIIYRIRRAHHHRTGDSWCIYPMYDYAHCLSDALEGITHSLCTLEFEDHRPLYDWILDHVTAPCHPRQYEFSRLQLLYTLTSKRKLYQLVSDGLVQGWDDPRMPTIEGMRRRGFSAEAIRLFAQRIGVAKSDNVVDLSVLEGAVRETLEVTAPRVMMVVQPLKVVLTNFTPGGTLSRRAPFHPHQPGLGDREVTLTREIWIEMDDFSESPLPGWQRLAPGREVRLRYSYVIKCDEVIKDELGNIIELRCSLDHQTLGVNPVGRKVKGVIHWVSVEEAQRVEVRLYDRLFTVPRPDAVRGDDGEFLDFRQFLNPTSLVTRTAWAEPIVREAAPEMHYQCERLGYFITDRYDHKPMSHVVLNRTVSLKDTWSKEAL